MAMPAAGLPTLAQPMSAALIDTLVDAPALRR
jgi:hypothetical protein